MPFRFKSREEYEKELTSLLEKKHRFETQEQFDACEVEYDELLDEYVEFCVEQESNTFWN
jgi:hypothetical protein